MQGCIKAQALAVAPRRFQTTARSMVVSCYRNRGMRAFGIVRSCERNQAIKQQSTLCVYTAVREPPLEGTMKGAEGAPQVHGTRREKDHDSLRAAIRQLGHEVP